MKFLIALALLCAPASAAVIRQNGVSASATDNTKLPLTGGTLTGALGGTSATFTDLVTVATFTVTSSTMTVGTNKLTVRGNNVGVGTVNPANLLDIGLLGGQIGTMRLSGSANNLASEPYIDIQSNFNNGILWRIGTSSTTDNLSFWQPATPSRGIYINSNGQLYVGGNATTQLFYCDGGTFTGNVCRGAACICTGGSATALGIFVP